MSIVNIQNVMYMIEVFEVLMDGDIILISV